MRLIGLVASLAVLALGAAACASSGSSPTSSSKAAPSSRKSTGPLRIYRLRLTGGKAETPPGAPAGAGDAVIAFHGSSVVCWRFVHLHGFVKATFAHIHSGAAGKAGNIVVPLSTGSALHHRGCVRVAAPLVQAIERRPAGYYVNIHSAQYPGGAVRAQL